ncbi:hypothetical protein K7640_17095 [Micromonospora sp. PLK6-60]|uniref:hypothetical protein n=1 Tax=Micromonospora sp. PLK6-60 TaxID=2873383 RepID=UPI001CA6A54A|nr:hypothetical protein [Micromonospora sp. PLK6-60]MBY8873554.1 hypothetical protein [Micromonospora sp. PLK6-60]
MGENNELGTCDLCGRPLDAEGENAWLALEVFRPESDYLNVSFCRQQHAAEWLRAPLPEVQPFVPTPRTRKDRLLGWAVAALFLWAGILGLLGAYALVRLLGGWD